MSSPTSKLRACHAYSAQSSYGWGARWKGARRAGRREGLAIGHRTELGPGRAGEHLPAERRNLPPSEIWTYHSTVCDVKLFFYPEVAKPTFRALTYQIDERDASDATHNACLSSLTKAGGLRP